MDFAFTSDQTLLKNSARAFLDEHCKPAAVRLLWDDPRGESAAMWKEMAQLGWLGLSLPEEHGGSGLGMVETALVLEELGRAAYPGPFWPTMLVARVIAEHGTSEQKKRWLPAIAGRARPQPPCSRACDAAPSAPPPRCWAPRAAAWTWPSATRRSARRSASPSAPSRPSATSAPRCCWRPRTRTLPCTTRRGRW